MQHFHYHSNNTVVFNTTVTVQVLLLLLRVIGNVRYPPPHANYTMLGLVVV